MWTIAIKAMLGDRAKLIATLLGVAFSVILVNLQAGLLLGLLRKTALLVSHGEADIWVGHRSMTNIDIMAPVPERWINRLRTVEGVERVEPYLILFAPMQMPDGRLEYVMVVGCDAASMLGNAWVMADGRPDAIRGPEAILVDVNDYERLGRPQIGDVREINSQRARIVGTTRGIVGLSTNPYVFTTFDRARTRYRGGFPAGYVSYFLVKLRPGVDRATALRAIKDRAPELAACEKDSFAWTCMEYWLTRTGIGISFGLAASLGLLVGLAVVAQTLHASVNERVKEFATLKALGADDHCVARFLVAQALGSAGIGSIVGLLVTVGLAWAINSPRAPVVLTWTGAAVSVLLVTAVCAVAAWLPYRRVRGIDPASVLRG